MVTVIDTLHSDMIHDAQFDYPGRRVATCSSDCTVRIYQVESSSHSNAATVPNPSSLNNSMNNTTSAEHTSNKQQTPQQQHRLVAILDGHDGPVWQVCWAHPKYGSLLASCSYDKKVLLWKETPVTSSSSNASVINNTSSYQMHNSAASSNSANNSNWKILHEYTEHTSSVNSIIWAPHELGLILAACSSDESTSIIDYTRIETGVNENNEGVEPEIKRINSCHKGGCNAVSWAPSIPPSALLSNDASFDSYQKKIVTGGCDNLVKIWNYVEASATWVLEQVLEGHEDWVRDVAWAPSVGLPISTIASCSQDGKVIIWRQETPVGGFGGSGSGAHLKYQPHQLCQFEDVVWHVSWSFTGNILAVSGGDNEVTLWKETEDNKWEKISDVNKSGK